MPRSGSRRRGRRCFATRREKTFRCLARAHAANENVRIQNLWDGIQVFAALFARLGTAWGQSPVAPPL